MKLLHVNLRSLLLYSLILVLISIPVSLFSIQTILNEEVDETISAQADMFMEHIKGVEYLDDLETDLKVLDKLSYNIRVTRSNTDHVERAFKTRMVFDSMHHERKPFRELSSSVIIKGKPYLLTVQMSLVENDDLLRAIAFVQIVFSIFLASGLLIMNRSWSKRLWKPFYKTLDQLKAYQLDKNESISPEKSNIDEFDDLNDTVSHLTERNRKVFVNQKEFIENASHELQTPIAIFQSKLDVLMQSPGLSQMEAETITELESTVQRMARLNKNLLLLSKIDNEQFIDREEIELSSLLQHQVNALQPLAAMEHLNIITTLDRLILQTNRALIEMLFTNLLHNAIRYSPKGDYITVTLKYKMLTITNLGTSAGIDLEKMTRRFQKESDNPNSTGLGLAIVKRICDSCAYELGYSYENSRHIFSVKFK